MENELIIVKQLPIIEEQLIEAGKLIDVKLNDVLSLEVNEATYKEIKVIRAELNKEFTHFEERRKEVKKQVMTPYENFEEIFKENISAKYNNADAKLKEKIGEVEIGLKEQKRADVEQYFVNYQSVMYDIPFNIEFDRLNLKIGLSSSANKLKDEVMEFFNKVISDIELINTQRYADEILVLYEKSLNASESILKITEKYKLFEEMKKLEEEKRQAEIKAKIKEQLTVSEMEIVEKEKVERNEVYTVCFKVTEPAGKLKALKSFLIENNISYENIK